MNAWIYDENGNSASIEKWGSAKEAQRSLKTLKRCKNCADCKGCEDCTNCIECYKCTDCSGCVECAHCAYCKSCDLCCLCVDCSNCTYCFFSEEFFHKKNNYCTTYTIPIIEKIHNKVYTAASSKSALNMNDWHSCDTCHCRAGWVVALAGSAGAALESKISTLFAAMLIYRASDPVNKISVLRFYDSNDMAMADMKRLAELEAAA